MPSSDGILASLGAQVVRLRRSLGLSQRELADRSGLSVRFLARVESGFGNISVLRLEALARALSTTAHELIRTGPEGARTVALVGLRGAGKSSVGPLLARRLGLPFVEIDQRIVEASGLPLDQLFELHGEPYYRRLERQILTGILHAGEPCVLAASGGVVNDPLTWELLRARATVVWLRARPEDHWNRVVAQGDRRPMAGSSAAMEELRALLRAREAAYASADLTVDTADASPQALAQRIASRLDAEGGLGH